MKKNSTRAYTKPSLVILEKSKVPEKIRKDLEKQRAKLLKNRKPN